MTSWPIRLALSSQSNNSFRNSERFGLPARDAGPELFLLVKAAIAESEFHHTAQYSAG
jgi:hypothetical protein